MVKKYRGWEELDDDGKEGAVTDAIDGNGMTTSMPTVYWLVMMTPMTTAMTAFQHGALPSQNQHTDHLPYHR